jgi:hypothetical protein
MSTPSHSTTSGNANRPDMIWSRSEKAIARRAFDAVLRRELQEVMQEAKRMASQIKEPSDLWALEQYLTGRRKEIDRKYDSRSSRLAQVFGRLLQKGRLAEEELRGLREDKLASIRSYAKFLAESDAA